MLSSLEDVLAAYKRRLGNFAVPDGTFPVNFDEGGGFVGIAKKAVRGEWVLEYLAKDGDGWQPLPTEWDVPSPTFDEYLDRLAEGIQTGRLELGREGDLVVRGAEPHLSFPFFRG